MKTFQLFSPVKELNGVFLITARPDADNYIRVVRNGRSLHHGYGIYITREGDEIYMRIPGDAKYQCAVLTVAANGGIDLITDIRPYPIATSTIPIESLFDVGEIESMHFIAKAYMTHPHFTINFIETLCHPSKEWNGDCMSLHRVLYTALRDANLAQTIYED